MEDIDSPRIKAGADQQAIEDLRWLGLDWDFGPGGTTSWTAAKLLPPDFLEGEAIEKISGIEHWQQTQRQQVYQHFFSRLIADEKVYPCVCSRKDIQLAASAPNLGDDALIYPGICAGNGAADAQGMSTQSFSERDSRAHEDQHISQEAGSLKFAWRYRTSDRSVHFVDGVHGIQQCCPRKELGDFVVGRSYGEFAYQLAVVIDDYLMSVSEVVRGDDLVASTFRQLQLYEYFKWAPPSFFHVPLVVGPDGRRLAKRHGDTRLSEIRKRGLGPEKLLGVLAESCRLTEDASPISARHLLEKLHRRMGVEQGGIQAMWSGLPRAPWVLTDEVWRAVSR